MIGADLVAKSAPDGYTLLINVSGQVINPYLYTSVPHDPLKDFSPITNLASTPIQLVVSANSRIKSIKELVDACRAEPGKYSFASSSNGTPGHLSGELFKSIAKLDVTHIPYKGVGPAQMLEPCGCRFSGDIEGLVTSHLPEGSSTRVSRKNRAAPFRIG